MAEQKRSNSEKLKEIVASIETGIEQLFQSEKFADYLRTMSRFHDYSYRNTLLIHMQRPDASRVAGFNAWKNKFGRHVKKGEKGITILAPTPFKKKVEEMKLDPDTKAPVLDSSGNAIMVEKIVEVPWFRPVKVFDVSQTDGTPLPSLVSDLTGDVRQYEAFMEALRRTSPVPISIKPIDRNTDGFFRLTDQTITIREGMSQVQTVCAAIHEITHAKLHNREQNQLTAAAGDMDQEPPKKKDKNTMEVEAEAVAFTVSSFFGIDTSTNSLGYIATWSKDKTLPELKASLETISKTANGLINDIERHFAAICKERGIDLSGQQEQLGAETPAVPQPEQKYVYKMEANPRSSTLSDRHFIQAYERVEEGKLKPEAVLFIGRPDVCIKLLEQLQNGTLQYDDFFCVNAARISHYTTKDGMELDALVAPDGKVYLGRSDHYDNCGHYLNQDKSLLPISDNEKMFSFLSGGGYSITQSEMLEQGHFTPEDYAEFAVLQAGILAQFEQIEPFLFAGEPFQFPLPDTAEPERSVPEPQEPDKAPQDTTLDEYPTPDPALTVKDLEQSGYLDGDMFPLSNDRAAEMLDKDFTIYAVVGGSAEMVFDREELDEYPASTIFTVSREEWEHSTDFYQAVADRLNRQEDREQAFLNHDGDCFAIYQVKRDAALRDIRFEPLEVLHSRGRTVERGNYDLAYTAPLPAVSSIDAALNILYEKFNIDHPADYRRPSMSVSDIIAVRKDDVLSCHYCDDFGFQQVPDFIKPENYLKNAEMVLEDDYNMIDGVVNNGPKEPTVAELEAQVKAGQQISLLDLANATHREQKQGKKSVVQKLKNQPKAERKKPAQKKNVRKER